MALKEKRRFLRNSRGNIYLEFALLAAVFLVAGALLAGIHPGFGLLVPIGIVIFFMPNILSGVASWQDRRSFRKQLASVQNADRTPPVVLRNEFRWSKAQGLWLDSARGELGLLNAADGPSTRTLDALRSVRAVFAEAAQVRTFHRQYRVPARYVLVFEFENQPSLELVTYKKRVAVQWIETLRPHLGNRLNTEGLEAKTGLH
jgi:hypothetical protein